MTQEKALARCAGRFWISSLVKQNKSAYFLYNYNFEYSIITTENRTREKVISFFLVREQMFCRLGNIFRKDSGYISGLNVQLTTPVPKPH